MIEKHTITREPDEIERIERDGILNLSLERADGLVGLRIMVGGQEQEITMAGFQGFNGGEGRVPLHQEPQEPQEITEIYFPTVGNINVVRGSEQHELSGVLEPDVFDRTKEFTLRNIDGETVLEIGGQVIQGFEIPPGTLHSVEWDSILSSEEPRWFVIKSYLVEGEFGLN